MGAKVKNLKDVGSALLLHYIIFESEMERLIRIGIPAGIWSGALENQLAQTFQPPVWQLETFCFPADLLQPALLRGDLDCLAQPLHLTPVTPPAGIVHAAIIERLDPAWHLLIQPDAIAKGLFRLAIGARVWANHLGAGVQLLDFRPDLRLLTLKEPSARWETALQQGIADALILPGPATALFEPEIVRMPLNPREICPVPGQGAILLQTCADDLPGRRLLQGLHRPGLSALTNVERNLLRLMGGDLRLPLGAFCERDPMGNFHLWAAFAPEMGKALRRTRLSSSTSFELAAQACAAFQ